MMWAKARALELWTDMHKPWWWFWVAVGGSIGLVIMGVT